MNVTTIVYAPGDGYTIDGIRDLETGASSYSVSLAVEPYLARIGSIVSSTYSPASKTDPSVRLTFDGYGVGDGDLTVVVLSNGASRTVRFDAASGRCSVQ